MIETISKMMNPLKSRLHQLIRLGVVTRVTTKEASQRVQLQLSEDDVQSLLRFQEFGFYSVPETDSRAVVLFPSGMRGNGLVICVSQASQKEMLSKLKPGEVALYNSNQSFISLKKDAIEISHGTAKIVLGENGKIEILSGGKDLISALKTLITKIKNASLTGSTAAGPVSFATAFPDSDSLKDFG